MLSYQENLDSIGIDPNSTVSYRRDFVFPPQSLRQVILSMQAPASGDWHLHEPEIYRDEYWTDEVQGVAWDGSNWIFSANANQSKPGHNDKALYVFEGGSKLKDDQWLDRIDYKDVPHPIASTEDDDHWGQLTYYDGFVYVSHFWQSGPLEGEKNVVVFKDDNGHLTFHKWIELGKVKPSDGGKAFYPEFQAINPWNGYLYTCKGGLNTTEFYIHDPESGKWMGDPESGKAIGKDAVLKFSGGEKKAISFDDSQLAFVPVDLPSNVQGACFSPNGHLYIACDVGLADNLHRKAIVCFSALTGYLMGIIRVVAEESGQELEGVCYGDVSFSKGKNAQIHAILLENRDAALDNIYFKSFSSGKPDIV
jgi:hypothetical protein